MTAKHLQLRKQVNRLKRQAVSNSRMLVYLRNLNTTVTEMDQAHPRLSGALITWHAANSASLGSSFCGKLISYIVLFYDVKVMCKIYNRHVELPLGTIFIEMTRNTDVKPMLASTNLYVSCMEFFTFVVNNYTV